MSENFDRRSTFQFEDTPLLSSRRGSANRVLVGGLLLLCIACIAFIGTHSELDVLFFFSDSVLISPGSSFNSDGSLRQRYARKFAHIQGMSYFFPWKSLGYFIQVDPRDRVISLKRQIYSDTRIKPENQNLVSAGLGVLGMKDEKTLEDYKIVDRGVLLVAPMPEY